LRVIYVLYTYVHVHTLSSSDSDGLLSAEMRAEGGGPENKAPRAASDDLTGENRRRCDGRERQKRRDRKTRKKIRRNRERERERERERKRGGELGNEKD